MNLTIKSLIGLLLIALCQLSCSKNNESNYEPSKNETLVLNWLTNLQTKSGLLPSTEQSNLVSLYDNSLAALAFVAYEEYDKADSILAFFNERVEAELTKSTGGFAQFRDTLGNPESLRWMGDNAWLLIAINNYHYYTGSNKYENLATSLKNWLIGLQDNDGGLWGGYNADNNLIHKVTEGNIDAFNAVPGYSEFHKNLLKWIENTRWDTSDQNLIAWPGNLKYKYALDLHPWGYCIFKDFPESVLHMANMYKTSKTASINNKEISGFCFDTDNDVVWLEGTGQMIVAYNKANMIEKSDYYLFQLEEMLIESKMHELSAGIPYATNEGTTYGSNALWYGADLKPAISSSAWYLFGKRKFDPFAVGYHKQTPLKDIFWNK